MNLLPEKEPKKLITIRPVLKVINLYNQF